MPQTLALIAQSSDGYLLPERAVGRLGDWEQLVLQVTGFFLQVFFFGQVGNFALVDILSRVSMAQQAIC